jgi:hypothetical protein
MVDAQKTQQHPGNIAGVLFFGLFQPLTDPDCLWTLA